jgi:hypothetical protein
MVAHYSATPTRSAGGLVGRVFLTLLGAAGLIVGAMLDWWEGIRGTDLTYKVLYQTTFDRTDNFVSSVGFVAIVIGLVAVVGLALPSGWLTRLAGALGIVAFVLFAIQGYRLRNSLSPIDFGAWLALAGAVVALIGGFLGRRQVAVMSATAPRHDDI